MGTSREKPWRLVARKGRAVQVIFDHMPGKAVSSGFFTRKEADEWARRRYARDTGGAIDGDKITLEEFAKDFFKPSDPRGFRKRQEARGYHFDDFYYTKRQGHLENYILPAHGKCRLDTISDVMIEDFILYLKRLNRRKGEDPELANDTKNKILAAYSDVMKEAKRQGYIRHNPCDGVDKMASINTTREPFTEQEMAVMFPDDRKQLMFIWQTVQWALYFMVIRDTGWRPGQVSGISNMNYYPEFHGIYTTGSVDSVTHKYKNSIKTTKKGQQDCIGFLSDQTVALLEEYMRYHPAEKYLFKINGEFIIPATANKHLKSSLRRAGIDRRKRTQYSFRHSFQDQFIGRMPEMARLVLMGHTKTRKEYTHLDAEDRMRRLLEINGVKELLDNRNR